MSLTVDQVLELSPDAASTAAGRKLSAVRSWKSLGQSDAALWGECMGSAVYQIRISRADWSYKCSCPSRKFPCKHVLGLMFLAAQDASALPAGEPPQWVSEWLEKRQATAQAREARKEKTPSGSPADPAKTARRVAAREERIAAGLERLDLWLRDLARQGLAELESRPFSFWDAQAASLVDAQAPGLAARVRNLAGIPGSSPDWPARLVEGLGRLTLILRAYRRLPELSPPLQAEVRSLVGWTMTQDELAAVGEPVEDVWAVLGQYVTDEDRLRVQRSWLWGLKTRRAALVLQFSAAGAAFPETIVPGVRFAGRMIFYPGACPQRARIAERTGPAEAIGNTSVHHIIHSTSEEVGHPEGLEGTQLPGFASPEAFLSAVADVTAHNPFAERFLCVLNQVVPVRAASGAWEVQSGDEALPLAGDGHWRLLALSGGRAVGLAGEWDGHRLLPLGVMAHGHYHLLPGGWG